jgi:septal ring factor EnvC (AmiA/AmiB activator)
VEVTQLQLQEWQSKYAALEECLKVKESGESEVKKELVQCRDVVDRLRSELEVVTSEKKRLEERVEQDGSEWNVERDRMQKEHVDLMQRKRNNVGCT